MLPFDQLCDKLKRPKDLLVVSFDPGETTGVAVLNGITFEVVDQLGTGDMVFAPRVLNDFLRPYWERKPYIVCEDYRIYDWKSDQHKWASLHTPRLIGTIETLIQLNCLAHPLVYKNMAGNAKTFCTDDRLKSWGFYTTKRHARDAIRHACYFVLFNKGVDHVQYDP